MHGDAAPPGPYALQAFVIISQLVQTHAAFQMPSLTLSDIFLGASLSMSLDRDYLVFVLIVALEYL